MICNFYLSVAARKIVRADPSLRYTSLLLGRKAANQQKKCSVADTAEVQLHYIIITISAFLEHLSM